MTRFLCIALAACGLPYTVFSYERPSGPNHDLTKTLDFPRVSTFVLGPTGLEGWMYVTNQMTTWRPMIRLAHLCAVRARNAGLMAPVLPVALRGQSNKSGTLL